MPEHEAEQTQRNLEAHSGLSRSRWRRAFWSVPRGMHIVLMVICFGLGVAIASQVIAQHEDPIDSLSQQDLVVLLEELSDKEDQLRQERQELSAQLAELEDATTQREAAEKAAQQARDNALINAALVPVHGPGVRITVNDPERALRASHFVMTVGELRNSGAEAGELNGIRFTMQSAFTSDDSGLFLDGQRIGAPYVWSVIGDPQTIATALDIPGGATSQMRAKGASVEVTQHEDLVIDSVAQPAAPRWASQAPSVD